ncbi:hypothetical protein QBC40DRAFT_183287 [Triangularia verruculosa]|uniref:Uncharacterized protein n=1 Tax=Triangularia verruculosa TaxID=2587418 RepID=A0AAN6X9M1_9PEZI|nr:hypothetical protein QBC40DRAFT_183287 [Triangularia verruculosa]
MCLPCWPITKTTYERGSRQSNAQRYRWHWSRTRNMWILRDTVRKTVVVTRGWLLPSELERELGARDKRRALKSMSESVMMGP